MMEQKRAFCFARKKRSHKRGERRSQNLVGVSPGEVAPPEELDAIAHQLLERARAILPVRRKVRIEWRNYPITAGRAYVDEGLICLSKPLLTTPRRVKDTVLHEYAHIYVYERWGDAARAHGPEWREAMRYLGLPPEVTHEYLIKRRRKPYAYVCQKCGAKFHRSRALTETSWYRHQNCGGRIVAYRRK
ncbi:MAG: SprT-like domain-containing protein [Fimbriimonadales bacterium]|nr:SprT-like domain-containing protein [Fimbriimonadales bacterium]